MAISFDTSAQNTTKGSLSAGGTYQISGYTVGSGQNACLLTAVSYVSSSNPGATATYNGVPMTRIDSFNVGSSVGNFTYFYLLNAPQGTSANIVFTLPNGGSDVVAIAASYLGVGNVSEFVSYPQTASQTSVTATASVPTDGTWLGMFACPNATPSAGTGMTLRQSQTPFFGFGYGDSNAGYAPGSHSITMNDSNGPWSYAAFMLQPPIVFHSNAMPLLYFI